MQNIISIAGATGNLGGRVASLLRERGAVVRAFVRPGSPRLLKLERDQGIVKTTGERVDVHVTDTLDEQIAYDSRGRSVVISVDTDFHPPLAAAAQGADVLVHEARSQQLVQLHPEGGANVGNAVSPRR